MTTQEALLYCGLFLPALALLWVAWRQLREALCWLVEQRLYRIRDRIFDLVVAGEASFDEPAIKSAIETAHFLIYTSRSHEIRLRVIESMGEKPTQTDPAAQLDGVDLFCSDKRTSDISKELYLYLMLSLLVELFTRYFFFVLPLVVVMLATRVSRRAYNAYSGRFAALVPVRPGALRQISKDYGLSLEAC